MMTVLDRLAFGRATPSGRPVTDKDWEYFERHEVAPRFPAGYTVTTAKGGWRDVATGITIQEDAILLDVAHEGKPEADGLFAAIADAYKRAFHQDGVMRLTMPVKAAVL